MPVMNASTKNGSALLAPFAVTTSSPMETRMSIDDRDCNDRAARRAVGEVPCRQREDRQRDEHREPDEPEVERVARDLVELPADRDERHLDREPGRNRRDEVEDEVAMRER